MREILTEPPEAYDILVLIKREEYEGEVIAPVKAFDKDTAPGKKVLWELKRKKPGLSGSQRYYPHVYRGLLDKGSPPP